MKDQDMFRWVIARYFVTFGLAYYSLEREDTHQSIDFQKKVLMRLVFFTASRLAQEEWSDSIKEENMKVVDRLYGSHESMLVCRIIKTLDQIETPPVVGPQTTLDDLLGILGIALEELDVLADWFFLNFHARYYPEAKTTELERLIKGGPKEFGMWIFKTEEEEEEVPFLGTSQVFSTKALNLSFDETIQFLMYVAQKIVSFQRGRESTH